MATLLDEGLVGATERGITGPSWLLVALFAILYYAWYLLGVFMMSRGTAGFFEWRSIAAATPLALFSLCRFAARARETAAVQLDWPEPVMRQRRGVLFLYIVLAICCGGAAAHLIADIAPVGAQPGVREALMIIFAVVLAIQATSKIGR